MGHTIYDISNEAGVSIATVSRVLNGNENVSTATRQKVLDVINDYGYTPNAFARGLGLNTMRTIGILCADSSDLYLAKAVFYLEQFLRKYEYDTLLCCTGYDPEHKQACMELLISKHVDGIILCGSQFLEENEHLNSYIKDAARTVPVMLLNADFDCPNVYSTLCDDGRAVANAVTRLYESGHKKILYLYLSDTFSNNRKKEGFMFGMTQCKAEVPLENLCYYQGERENIEGMVDYIDSIAKKGVLFDAIIASEDILALAAVKYAIKNNINIPNDLSVVGYNNSILANCCNPELTSIDNQPEKLCKTLVKSLIDLLNQEPVPPKTIFYGELIERGTTHFTK